MRQRQSKYCNPSYEVVIDPVYCPEVVAGYCSHGSNVGRKSRTTAVKQHLSSIGWKFYNADNKAGTKRELKYCSPTGKIFHSLLTACESCLREHPAEPTPIPDRGIKRKLLQSPSSERDKRKKTDDVAAIGVKVVSDGDWFCSSCDSVSSEGSCAGNQEETSPVTLEGLAAMLRAFQKEEALVEEAEFIDQENIWWMDELFLNLRRTSC